jgi:hypothetical protein
MIDKQKRATEWLRQHTLTKEQQQKLIREKFERAQYYLRAQQKREAPKEVR